jgi:hypothetical protein
MIAAHGKFGDFRRSSSTCFGQKSPQNYFIHGDRLEVPDDRDESSPDHRHRCGRGDAALGFVATLAAPVPAAAHRQLNCARQGDGRGPGRRSVWLGLSLVALLGCAADTKTTVSQPLPPPPAPGTARVWFLRAWDAPSGQSYVYGATPIIFANGAPVGDIPTGSKFFHDFSPGTHRFHVQPYGLPTSQAITVQLTAGTQAYIQVQWVASWEFGYPEADFSFAPNTFVINNMPPQVAQAYLPTLTNLGQR